MATVRISARARSMSYPRRKAVQTLHVHVDDKADDNRETTHFLRDDDLLRVCGGDVWVKDADILRAIERATSVHVTAAAKKMISGHASGLPLEVLMFVTTDQTQSTATHFAATLARRGIKL